MWTRKHSLRFWDRILGFKISSVMLLGNQPRSWSCRRSPKIQPGREGRRSVPNSLQVAWVGPPSGAWEAGGRETAESGRPSQGPPALTPADGKAQTGCTPRSWGGAALLGGTVPVPREVEEPPTPCAIAGPTRIDSGTHSQSQAASPVARKSQVPPPKVRGIEGLVGWQLAQDATLTLLLGSPSLSLRLLRAGWSAEGGQITNWPGALTLYSTPPPHHSVPAGGGWGAVA